MRSSPALFKTLLALSLASQAVAAPGDGKTLMIQGRTTDPEGLPLERVRVWAEGTRRAATISGPDGQFSLFIPIGTADDLSRGSLTLQVRAERRGWRFSIPGGDPALALELSLEVAGPGMARCVARSNQARFAASAAKVVGLDGGAVGVTEVSFLGVRGEAQESARLPELQHVAQVALRFPVREPPRAAPVEPRARAAPPQPPEERSQAADQEKERRADEAERLLSDPRARKIRDSLETLHRASAKQAERLAGAQKALERVASRGAQDGHGGEVDPKAKPRSAARVPLRRDTLRVARAEPAEVDSQFAHWRDARWRREEGPAVAARREPPPRSQPEPERTSKRAPAGGESRTEGVAGPAGPTRDPAPRGSAGGEPTRPPATLPPPRPSPEPSPSPSPAGEPTARSGFIHPDPPMRLPRARARPLVLPAPRNPSSAPAESCQCRIKGTLEVQSDRPLERRERIEVSLHWYPQLRDTVELFMGSPRPFRLPAAPCGPQRLRLRVLSGQRFEVLSREAMAGFRCDGGRLIQPRLVITPR